MTTEHHLHHPLEEHYPGPTPVPAADAGIDRLFVTVGTDYHRFDRLIGWLDEWLETEPAVKKVVVQRGTSRDADHADRSVEYISRSELIEEFRRASVVVCHGGPATILECRSNGIVPIVVPREQRYGEHVNDHQVDFCVRLDAHEEIQLARTKHRLFELLDQAVERSAPEVAVDDGHTVESLERFEDAMVGLLGTRARSARLGEMIDMAPLAEQHEPIPLVFVGSVPRSGSTILAELLDQHPHVVNVGEVVHLWERGLVSNDACGCGHTFSTCPFWSEVGDLAFGGWSSISGNRMVTLKRRIDRTRFIPALLSPVPLPPITTSMHQYGQVLVRLLRAASEVSGAPVVVDTSKHVSTALLLRRIPGVDLRIVHLVRDPRGVAHSWTKTVQRPEAAGEKMHRLHPGRIGLRWLWFNWAFGNMDRLGVDVRTLRYEDFVADPAAALDQIFSFVGAEPTGSSIVADPDRVDIVPGHSVSGNPRRFDREAVSIRNDEGWRSGMSSSHRRLVSALTSAMRARYRYREDS